MPSKELVCVVIPIYRTDINADEQIALEQCFRILGKHPIYIVKPTSLDISLLQSKFQNMKVENFDDSFFTNVLAYNRLVLSEQFYGRFEAYEFMLIYQLDAYVFRDDLVAWCHKNYDYIGAPWRTEIEFSSKTAEFLWQIKKKIALWLNLKEEKFGKYGPSEIIFKRTVGNGGFSLRRIEKIRHLIAKNQVKIEKYLGLASSHSGYNEDAFLAVELNRYAKQLAIPDWEEALHFAIEHQPEKSIKQIGGLPFGCHAWDIYETNFWRKYIFE